MNKERLAELAKWLEDGAPHRQITFDMSHGFTLDITEKRFKEGSAPSKCGASCCIAGAALHFFDNPKLIDNLFAFVPETGVYSRSPSWQRISNRAREVLDLEPNQAARLFLPNEHPDVVQEMEELDDPDPDYAEGWEELGAYSDPEWAARVIRKLIATGEVDWAGTYTPEPENA